MEKTVFLVANSDGDYGAMIFEENFNPQKIYEEMVSKGVTRMELIHDDPYFGQEKIYVKIYEFGAVDPKFVGFLRDNILDYDMSKHKDFYEVNPV